MIRFGFCHCVNRRSKCDFSFRFFPPSFHSLSLSLFADRKCLFIFIFFVCVREPHKPKPQFRLQQSKWRVWTDLLEPFNIIDGCESHGFFSFASQTLANSNAKQNCCICKGKFFKTFQFGAFLYLQIQFFSFTILNKNFCELQEEVYECKHFLKRYTNVLQCVCACFFHHICPFEKLCLLLCELIEIE